MVPTVRCWKCNTSHIVGKACACSSSSAAANELPPAWKRRPIALCPGGARCFCTPEGRHSVVTDAERADPDHGRFTALAQADRALAQSHLILSERLRVLELELAELRKRPAVHSVPVHDVVLSMNAASIAPGGTYSPGILSMSRVAPLALELISDQGARGVVLRSARLNHMTLYHNADIPCDGRILPVAWPTMDPGVALELEFLNIYAGPITVRANLYGLLCGEERRRASYRAIMGPSDADGSASGHSSGIRGS